jgi:mono/diheme cytochrome c family protein
MRDTSGDDVRADRGDCQTTTASSNAGRRNHPSHLSYRASRRSESRISHLASGLAYLASAFLLAGCRSTTPPKPLDQLTPQEAHGHQVFEAHCAVCHYDRQEGPLHGPSLLGLYKKTYLPSGAPANDDRVSAAIEHGRGMMPPARDLDPASADFTDLLAYLHTL